MPQRTVKLVILSTPPSVNNYVRHPGGGGHYKIEKATTFETLVALAWRETGFVAPKAKTYGIDIKIYLGAGQRGDVDNFPKTILDALVRVGALESDAWVTSLSIEKFRDRERPRTEVTVDYR